MRTRSRNRINLLSILLLTSLLCYADIAWSQLCSDNVNTVYGLTTAGELYPVNINTGVVGTLVENLTDGVNPAANSNAMGFNPINAKFYYFYRCASATAPNIEFVSYNPATNSLQVLSAPGLAAPATTKMRSGCVNPAGTGYYTFEITATAANLWYYNIITNTWTNVSGSFKNGATDYTANFKTLNSGDMAFDVKGNLWIVISNSTNYAMYLIPNPVPTAAVAGITNMQQLIAPTATPGGVSITGFCFNANGIAYLNTGSGVGVNNNNLYKMTSTTSGLTYIATLSLNSAGDDFTSCSFSGVLPVKWLGFTAKLTKGKGVQLTWDISEDINVKEYHVENSTDATHWKKLATIKRKTLSDPSYTHYDYNDLKYCPGKSFYRIVQEDLLGTTQTSNIEQLIAHDEKFSIGPNPAIDKITINQSGIPATQAEIYDTDGKLILRTRILYPSGSIDVSRLVKGNYFLKLSAGSSEIAHTSFLKL
ncbi:MAG: T9SS type A sorting domain-containing protein [Flavisolibacter sp.]